MSFIAGYLLGLGESKAAPVIESLTVTANGTYTAPDGTDGYSPVNVNVPTYEEENRILKQVIDVLTNPDKHTVEIKDSSGNPVTDPDGNPVTAAGIATNINGINRIIKAVPAPAVYIGNVKIGIRINTDNDKRKPVPYAENVSTGEIWWGSNDNYEYWWMGTITQWSGITSVNRELWYSTWMLNVGFSMNAANGTPITVNNARISTLYAPQWFKDAFWNDSAVYVAAY